MKKIKWTLSHSFLSIKQQRKNMFSSICLSVLQKLCSAAFFQYHTSHSRIYTLKWVLIYFLKQLILNPFISLDLDITWSHILEKSFIYNYLIEILFCVLSLSLYNILYLMLCTFCLFNFEIRCKSKSTDYLDYNVLGVG